VNVPLTFQFKHQFGSAVRPSNFGITGAVGAVFGLYNRTTTQSASGTFSYEAVYKLSPETRSYITGFDDRPSPTPDNASLVLTEQVVRNNNGGRNVTSYFDSLRDQGGLFNVGLGKGIAESQRKPSGNFNDISYGAIAQLGISYALAYNVTFQLNGYIMYQSFTNTGKEGYRPTERVIQENGNYYVNYNAMTSGMRKADYTSYGVSAGFRIFFGEKRDVDGDKVPDAIDKCKLEYGEARFNGCPDTDGDGIVDDQDACKFEKGPEYTNGCPDRDEDGVADKVDRCPDEYGELRNGCPVSIATRDAPIDTTLIGENGAVMAPHIVLETDAIYFDLGKSNIKDSAAAILDYAAKILETNPKVVIHITGYTDDIGTYQNNILLSYERSRAARTHLISRGVNDKRIIISGYGTENPLRPNTTPENRAKNRRIEFKLLLPL
jgi:outer membrane protein OmpA-like peptidoglycan-associated protein